ncbi:3-isopropylmalate dehydratase large subunit [Companilactobacillus insicii]|uniref:3-isopropylmalate dehydratase large subunit n=1 Tax=Companilactobacillus insicii TaxID=1732567 RepID=UPI000F783FFB|nr:aconitase/3-isopropylmalate dehydratase large subunit family protein [Companilactobacillus insicii]
MANTLVEKILMKNTGIKHVEVGDIVISHPDMFMVHDIYTPYLYETLKEMETEKLDDPDKVTIMFDHCLPTAVAKNDSVHYDAGINLSKKYGIKKVHIGEGICHTLMHEYHYAKPGTVVTATDSHTTTYGGGGCFCTGIGTAEMGAALTTGELWFKIPSAIKVILKGKFKKGVYAKDLIETILGDIRSDGAQYKSIEFTGEGVKNISMESRYTICNMGLEAGAKCALFPADEKTAEYFDMDLKDIEWVKPDEDAKYERTLEYDLGDIQPSLSCPQGVDNVHGIDEVKGKKVQEVYIGSCTNGSIEDLGVAANILKNKKIAPYMKLIVVPASNTIFKQAIELGYIQTFIEAGGVISHPSCALCCGMPYGLLSDDEAILSTANRNFIGRMGTKKSLIYLGSPAIAAVTALNGEISDPREYLEAEA